MDQSHSPSGVADEHHGHGHHDAKGKYLVALSLGALGVVYGDIGTSPLYALRECFNGHHPLPATPLNIYGVLSLIFWSLMLVITLKYVSFILRADNDGEGGIMALTALATPIKRYQRSGKRWVMLLGVFGAALLYGDGIITPAISVLSAVEGLELATPALSPFVIEIALVILVGLFLIQRRGTASIGKLFGPVMLVWFSVLALLGIVNILKNPAVFQAINPWYAVEFFRVDGWKGFLILGTVFLVVTGGEALYADMGHFGAKPIRLAWLFFVLPALLLNYFGQGALLLTNPEAFKNPLYLMAPSWALYPLIALATMATIIASQALISGAYSITMQAEHLGFLPRLSIIHTSPTAFGQIYIPFVNWLLMIGCILTVLGFRTSSNLAAAYGIAVTSTMAITTVIFGVVARERWKWNPTLVYLLVGFFLTIDLAFLGANLVKIPQGGWFPLIIAIFLFLVMTTWKRGSRLVYDREQHLEVTIDGLKARMQQERHERIPGTALFLSSNPLGAPAALLTNMEYNHVLHENILLITVNNLNHPHLGDRPRTTWQALGDGMYQVVVNFGFMEEADIPAALRELNIPNVKIDLDNDPYFVSRTRAIPTHLPGMALWREHFYRIMRQNATSPVDFFKLPANRVFEISTAIEF